MRSLFSAAAVFGASILGLPALAQVPPNAYNSFHLEATIVSSELQSFEAPGPPGSGPEAVCLLRLQPYFHIELPEQPEVDVWMQGGAVPHCLEWGEERRGDNVVVDGYLARVEAGGIVRTAVKFLALDILGEAQ